MQPGTTLVITLAVLVATPTPTTSFSIDYLRRELRTWMNIIQTHVTGPQVIKTTQIWNFNPRGGLARRQKFKEMYGERGEYLVQSVGKGEDAFRLLTSQNKPHNNKKFPRPIYPPPRYGKGHVKPYYTVPSLHIGKPPQTYVIKWTNHISRR